MPVSAHRDEVVGAVQDPWGDGKERLLVTINSRVDVLEQERTRRRISEDAYQAGCIVQRAFEHVNRVGGSSWGGGSRKDPAEVRDGYAQRLIDDEARGRKILERMRGRLGWYDARLLQRIVGEGRSFADCAALIGRAGPKGEAYIASRFRDALEQAVLAFEARGKLQPTLDDAYAAAASGADDRQDISVIGGATLARLEGEVVALEAGAPIPEGVNRQTLIAETKRRVCDQRLRKALTRARRSI